MTVKSIPDGYHVVTPHLIVDGAAAALAWYAKAFGAQEVMRHEMPGGKVMHAEFRIGDSVVMLADEFPEMGAKSPLRLAGNAVSFMLYVPDVDAVFARAVAEGAKVERPVQTQFYGDRTGTVIDPFGHKWSIATHVEDVAQEEMERRMAAAGNGAGGS